MKAQGGGRRSRNRISSLNALCCTGELNLPGLFLISSVASAVKLT
jgi:hypothetical protein